MVKVTVNSQENFEQALSKFKRAVAKEGILRDFKIKSHFENNREKDIRRRAAAKKRGRKKAR